MSNDRIKEVSLVEISVQSQSDAKDSDRRWGSDPRIRMYGYSPGITALQILGKLNTKSSPPAYAHALLNDKELLWLYAAVVKRMEYLGLKKKDAPDIDDVYEP